MPTSAAHLGEWALELLAEGALPAPERELAAAHLERCERCAAELEAYRSLFTALGDLPRFAPAQSFNEAVMARVRIGPPASALALQLERWMPSTRRGWLALLTALGIPSISLVGMVVWLLTHPLVSARGLGEWLVLETGALISAGLDAAVGWGRAAGASMWARTLLGTVQGVPLDTLLPAIAAAGFLIPLSGWALYRLARTPTGNATYAN